MRIVEFLFHSVQAVLECAEFRLFCTELFFSIHFRGLSLLFFRRCVFELNLVDCNRQLDLLLVCWRNRSVVGVVQ